MKSSGLCSKRLYVGKVTIWENMQRALEAMVNPLAHAAIFGVLDEIWHDAYRKRRPLTYVAGGSTWRTDPAPA